jgi:hypothetical protein
MEHSTALGKLSSEPLHSLLRPDEVILHVGSGRLIRRVGLSQNGWLVTVTTQRVLFTRDGSTGRTIVEFDRSTIRSAESHISILGSRVVVRTDSESVAVDRLSRNSATALAAAILRRPGVTSNTAAPAALPASPLSTQSHEAMLDRIERLEAEMEELREQVRFLEALPDRGALRVPIG